MDIVRLCEPDRELFIEQCLRHFLEVVGSPIVAVDRVVPFDAAQLHDAGDAAVVPHDLMATLAAARAKTAEETRGQWYYRQNQFFLLCSNLAI